MSSNAAPLTSFRSSTREPGVSARRSRAQIHDAVEALCADLAVSDSGDRPGVRYGDAAALFLRAVVAALAGERMAALENGDGWARESDARRTPRGESRSWEVLQARFAMTPQFAGLLPLHGRGRDWQEGIGERAVRQMESAVEMLRATSTSSYDTVSSVYQDLLDGRTADGSGRRRHGIFYTPRPIAHLTAECALKPIARRAPLLRIADPAMGTGVFLLESARILHAHSGKPLDWIAEHCLYGVDSDPVAVDLAIILLWLETGAHPQVLREHLRCGDGLDETALPALRYDAVVGNPPWGATLTAGQIEQCPALGRSARDSFKLFLDRASEMTRGTLGMVVPQAVLAQSRHEDIRALLLERLAPYGCIDLGDGIFHHAAAPACVLVFGPRPGPAHIACRDMRTAARKSWREPWAAAPTVYVHASRWTPDRFARCGTGLLDLLQRLQEGHPSLGDLYRIRDTGINYSRASVARRSLYHADAPQDPNDLPTYRGRDFHRYTPIRRGGWLRHDVDATLEPGERFSLGRRVCRLPRKVVIRQTADRLIATLDETRMAMGRSVIAITGEDAPSLHALLACLNSSLLTALYRAMAGEEGRILPQVKVARLEQLPIPDACATPSPAFDMPSLATFTGPKRQAAVDRAATDRVYGWQCLHVLAHGLLESGGDASELESAVDEIVFHLYGLTPAEIEMVRCCGAAGN